MAIQGYYANSTNRDITDGNTLPLISQDLDSIRAYQWEITFHPPTQVEVPQTFSKPLTLAAKQVNGIGMMLEDIEVNRVNDKVYYPGRPSTEELVVTFDNLLKSKTGFQLYKFMQTIYDPLTGEYTSTFLQTPGAFKTNIDLVQLDSRMQPFSVIKLLGAYPKKFTPAEYNYGTNDFHTVEMTFRYDFINHLSDPVG